MIIVRKIFLLSVLISSLSSCSRYVSPEELGKTVLESFQKNDVELALDFLMYEDDYDDFFSNSTLNIQEKDRLINKHTDPSYIEERIKRFKRRFIEIVEQGEEAGIVWKNTTYEYIEGPDNKSFGGMQADEIYVFFSFQSTIYKLRLDDCYKCSSGWLMSDEPSFEGAINSK